jgi:hypothetical protein
LDGARDVTAERHVDDQATDALGQHLVGHLPGDLFRRSDHGELLHVRGQPGTDLTCVGGRVDRDRRDQEAVRERLRVAADLLATPSQDSGTW